MTADNSIETPWHESCGAYHATSAPCEICARKECEICDSTVTEAIDAFPAILAALSEPLSNDQLKSRVGWTDKSGMEHEVEYIEWHQVADILDRIYPRWSHEVRQITQIDKLVAVTASITIADVTRQGVGTGGTDEKGIKKAEHDALKRAAIKFGLARHLYKREGQHDSQPPSLGRMSAPPNYRKPTDPVARTMASLVTPKQLVAVRAIANAQGVNAESLCEAELKCRPEELSRKAASWFIDFLKQLPNKPPAEHPAEKETARQEAHQDDIKVRTAKTIAALGYVERDYEGFNVKSIDFDNKATGFATRVWRNDDGRVQCSCASFQENYPTTPRYRCEHILAVKFYLEPPETVPPLKPITPGDKMTAIKLAESKQQDPIKLAVLLFARPVASIDELSLEEGKTLIKHIRQIQV